MLFLTLQISCANPRVSTRMLHDAYGHTERYTQLRVYCERAFIVHPAKLFLSGFEKRSRPARVIYFTSFLKLCAGVVGKWYQSRPRIER